MKYRSTRGDAPLASAAEAIVRGIAPDGGLVCKADGPAGEAVDLCVKPK